MAVADYNTDPDLNTTISGINIAEGCPPSGINNAIRQMMADIKDKADSTDTAVTTLDANAVKLSGAQTISGTKTFTGTVIVTNDTASIKRSNNTGGLRLAGGTGVSGSEGAYLSLFGASHASLGGYFRLYAETKLLEGTPSGSLKWQGNTIQTTSDERLKTAFSYVPDSILDTWGAVDWEQFKYREACEEKGEANARWHTGLVAQHVKEVFDEEAQDALQYGILCHDEWEDEYATDDEGKQTLVRHAGDLWTIRYEEALCMEAAYQRRRADRAEARITALEQRLNEMEQAIAALAGGAE